MMSVSSLCPVKEHSCMEHMLVWRQHMIPESGGVVVMRRLRQTAHDPSRLSTKKATFQAFEIQHRRRVYCVPQHRRTTYIQLLQHRRVHNTSYSTVREPHASQHQ